MPAVKKLRPGQRPVWAPVEVGVSLDRVEPTPGWVVLQEQFIDETTSSGIIIAKPYVANTVFGRVVAINDIDAIKTGIEAGMNIVYREYSGGRWSFIGSKVLITPLEAILAWYEE
jgi:co-chaperonin GroES (HSP10)